MGVAPGIFLKADGADRSHQRIVERLHRTQVGAAMNNFAATIPILIVVLSAIAAMLAEAIRHPGRADVHRRLRPDRPGRRRWSRRASCGTPTPISFGVVRADNFALFINIILCIVGILTMVFSHDVVEREGLPAGEYYALTLFAISGMMLMAAATDLLVIFLALEVLSLAVYVLTGLRRSSAAGAEAAFKYFLLGAFSSAFFLYGIAFAFTIAGSTRLDALGTAIASGPNRDAGAARGRPARRRLLLQGLGGAVPHVDAGRLRRGADDRHGVHVHRREGGGVRARSRACSCRRSSRCRGTGSRCCRRSRSRRWSSARCSACCRTTSSACSRIRASRTPATCCSASSRRTRAGKAAVLFYLLTYAVANLGALGIVALLGTAEHPHDQLRDFAGLWKTPPGASPA